VTTQQRDFLVGLFVLIGLGVLAGAWLVTSGLTEERYELLLRAESAEDLNPDTRVVLQGLTVGRVRSIVPEIDSTNGSVSFVARLTVQARFPNGTELRLPLGTNAVISKPNPVAPSVINLRMPERAAPGQFLEPGDVITSTRPDDPLAQLGDVARQLNTELTAVLADVRRVLEQSDGALRDARGLLRSTRPAVDGTLELVQSNLARSDSLLATLSPRVGPLADSLALALEDSRRVLARLDSLASTAHDVVDENRDIVVEIAASLQRSARILEHFADQISRRPTRLLTGVRPPADSTP
jgi:ABC-type transporter Mla subunit MlaD